MAEALSLSQLKKDIAGKLTGVLCYSDTPCDRLLNHKGELSKDKGDTVIFRTDAGARKISLPKASLVTYTGETITIYESGYRYMTKDEKAAMDGWSAEAQTKEYREKAARDRAYRGYESYWHKRSFFENLGMVYLMGKEEVGGKILSWDKLKNRDVKCIRDSSVKGKVLFQFIIKPE